MVPLYGRYPLYTITCRTEKYLTFTSADFFPWPFSLGMDSKRLLLRDRRLDPHCSGSSINRDLLTRGDAFRGSCDPNDRRDPVLAGHAPWEIVPPISIDRLQAVRKSGVRPGSVEGAMSISPDSRCAAMGSGLARSATSAISSFQRSVAPGRYSHWT